MEEVKAKHSAKNMMALREVEVDLGERQATRTYHSPLQSNAKRVMREKHGLRAIYDTKAPMSSIGRAI